MSSVFQRVLLVGASLLVAGLILEGTIRILSPRTHSIVVEHLGGDIPSDVNLEIENDSARPLLVRTPTGIRLMQNSRAYIRNHPINGKDTVVETNSQGHRHRQLPPKSSRDHRVLMLGDSITFGSYLPASETIPAHIETRLQTLTKTSATQLDFEVINAGIGGIDLQNELAILLETSPAVEPDLVLVGLYLNDANASLYLEILRLPAPFDKSRFFSWLFDRLHILRARLAANAIARDSPGDLKVERSRFARNHPISDERWETSDTGFNRRIHRNFHDWGFAWSDTYWNKARDLLSLMQTVALEQGAEFAVVLFPVRMQVHAENLRSEPQQRFEALMDDLGVAHLDLLPLLREAYQDDGLDLFYDYCHYNATGTSFVGKAIADFLAREMNWVDPNEE